MSKPVKIVLGVVILLVLLVAALVVGGVLWFNANKGRLVEEGRAQQELGAAFGAGKSNQECLREMLTRADACMSLFCEVRTRLFGDACLKASLPSPGFCDGVPKTSEILKSATWAVTSCVALARAGNQGCQRSMQTVQKFCEGQ